MTAKEARELNKFALTQDEKNKMNDIYSNINMTAQSKSPQNVKFKIGFVTTAMRLNLERNGFNIKYDNINTIISW